MTSAPEIDVINDHPEIGEQSVARLRDLAIFAIGREQGAADLRQLSILLTTDERIAELHRRFMGIDGPTDVMTFPAELEPGVGGRGGDIVISVDTARENAVEAGHATGAEVAFLVVHGILHLAGWDDGDYDQRARMLARQTDLIQSFENEN